MVSPCLAVLTEEGHVHENSLSMATAERCPSVSLSPVRHLAVAPPSSFSLSVQHMFISHECRCQAPDKLADAAASLLAKLVTKTGKFGRARTVASSYSRSSPLPAPRAENARMSFSRMLDLRHVPTACRVRAKATCKESPRTALSFLTALSSAAAETYDPAGQAQKVLHGIHRLCTACFKLKLCRASYSTGLFAMPRRRVADRRRIGYVQAEESGRQRKVCQSV